MLAGEPDAESARQRCVQLLGIDGIPINLGLLKGCCILEDTLKAHSSFPRNRESSDVRRMLSPPQKKQIPRVAQDDMSTGRREPWKFMARGPYRQRRHRPLSMNRWKSECRSAIRVGWARRLCPRSIAKSTRAWANDQTVCPPYNAYAVHGPWAVSAPPIQATRNDDVRHQGA